MSRCITFISRSADDDFGPKVVPALGAVLFMCFRAGGSGTYSFSLLLILLRMLRLLFRLFCYGYSEYDNYSCSLLCTLRPVHGQATGGVQPRGRFEGDAF